MSSLAATRYLPGGHNRSYKTKVLTIFYSLPSLLEIHICSWKMLEKHPQLSVNIWVISTSDYEKWRNVDLRDILHQIIA